MSVENLPPGDVSTFRGKRTSLPPRTRKVISFILTFSICFVTWIILSDRFDLFHIVLGVIACSIVSSLSGSILISRRKLEQLPRQWLRFIGYIPWLLYQIFLANLQIMYLVFHPRMIELIDPKIIRFKSRLKKPMSLFIFANSITLTPGTITVHVSITGEYAVHVINEQAGSSLPGEMEERVARIIGE